MWKQLNVTDADKIMVINNDGTWVMLSEILKGKVVLMDMQCSKDDELSAIWAEPVKDENGKQILPDAKGRLEKGQKKEKVQQDAIAPTDIWKDGNVKFDYNEMLDQLMRDCKDPKEIIRMKGIVKSDKAVMLKNKFNWAADHIGQELGLTTETVRVYLSHAKLKENAKNGIDAKEC